MPGNTAQKVDEKNGIICLVVIFTPSIMVIKMSKISHFLHFLLITAKHQSQFGEKIAFSSFRKCHGFIGF